MRSKRFEIQDIAFVGVMAAFVYVVTMFRFPLLGSKVHFANALCLLAGLLLGPLEGGLAAGIGSALYDWVPGGYGFVELLITFVSKFAMAFVCAKVFYAFGDRRNRADRSALSAFVGALTYVALYMLKTFVFQRFVYGFPMDAVAATMIAKLIPSLINAGVAIVSAPIFYHALVPALRAGGVLRHMRAGA